MDRQIDSFLGTLGFAFVFYYNRLTNVAAPYVEQAYKSLEALRKSFSAAGIYCFYEGVHVPVYLGDTINSTSEHAEKPVWYYISEDNVFVNDIHDFDSALSELKRIPWLSADIVCDGTKVADISDFVTNLRYCGELPPTPDVLLSLWSFNNQYLLRRSHTVLDVICFEGDTHTFHFSSIDEDDSTWRQSLGLTSALSSDDQ